MMKTYLPRITWALTLAGLVATVPSSAAARPNGAPAASSIMTTMPQYQIDSVDRGYVSPVSGTPTSLAVLNYFNPPPRPWDAGFHRGVDLYAEPDSVVVAPGTGIVTFAGYTFGKPTVSIAHPDGLTSSLEPVSALVNVGDAVTAGTPIGTLDWWPAETGSNSTHCPGTTCLHWGVRRAEDTYVDPLWLLGIAPPIVLLPLMDSQ